MPPEAKQLKVYFLDVGQGDCTFVVPPRGEGDPILFDCRDAYVAERFVANHEMGNLSAVIASHLDLDHVRGLLSFLKNHFALGRRVQQLVIGLDRNPAPGADKTLQALIEQALAWEKAPPNDGFALCPPFRTGTGPVVLASGSDWKVELVLPWFGTMTGALAAGGQDHNLCSAVLRISRGSKSLLVGGDAPLRSWERLDEALRPADVIRVPHHGGEIRGQGERWNDFAQLYDAVAAQLAVVSVGTHNDHGHPVEAHALAARRGGECRLLCTQLTPRCQEDPQSLREAALEQAGLVEWPYRHRKVPGHPQQRPPREVPCAASVVVALGPDGQMEIEPSKKSGHTEFLRSVDRPLCKGVAHSPVSASRCQG